MKTLTEIVATTDAIKRRAYEYECAKGRVENLQRRIARLQAAKSDAIPTLERIIELANTLPASVHGSLSGLVPIAGEIRYFVSALASSALSTLKRTDEQRVAQLRDAEQQLKSATKALASFQEPTNG